jgi:hypothetical protein
MDYQHYLPKNITEIKGKAIIFSNFRNKCKEYLIKNNVGFDKFTIVSHDNEIGYISEKAFELYLKSNYPDIAVSSWENEFDIRKIISILNDNLTDQDSVNLVSKYFYDKYDLKLSYKDKNICIDVKTAKTEREPRTNWKFQYPKIQSDKPGKDYIVLIYCIYNKNEFIDTVIIGAMKHSNIKNYNLVKKGSINRNYAPSQTENYETDIKDYLSIDKLINYLKSST